MPYDDNFQLTDPQEKQEPASKEDLRKIFNLFKSNWLLFLISLFLSLSVAFLYFRFNIPVYRSSAALLIDEENRSGATGNDQIFEGFGLGAGAKNLDNQIMILSSKTLINKTIDELEFDLEYFHRGLFNQIALYPYQPILVTPQIADSLPRNVIFRFKYLDNHMFNICAKAGDSIKLDTIVSFGSSIKLKKYNFKIERNLNYLPDLKKNEKIFFVFHDRKKLVESYKNRLAVTSASKNGTIVNVILEGTNKTMDVNFLDKLTEIFLNNSLDKKNQEAIRTIQFIDDQLIGISDSLVITETKLQEFRSRNRVMDLSAQGQVIIDQAMSLDNEKARLGIEANYYNYLADYLAKDNVGQAPIAPATMGITDPGLTRLVTDLAEIQGQFYSKSLGEKNPLQSQLAQRLQNTKEALRETLNGVRRANNLAMMEITEQIRTVNAQAAALPMTERQLLGIERRYKLNDELYTFLLEKRAEAQIQKASNMPDNELIDPSDFEIKPIKPKLMSALLVGLLAGFGLPLIWIMIEGALNNKIKDDKDIRKIADIPISGHIPRNPAGINKIVFDEAPSATAEAFRSLRSTLQFMTKEAKSPVILITSSMPQEGKTITAINLASAFSLIGKKTLLVDFDLRKPQISIDFGLKNDKGISTWLLGKDEIQDVVKETSYENLFVLPAGPLPPNPSELIGQGKTNNLFNLLNAMFDYIIIDSSPIGLVSDASHLSTFSDTCILIVRQNRTTFDFLRHSLNEMKTRGLTNMCIVLNDTGSDLMHNSYYSKYYSSYSRSSIKG
jgi:capsular exopolysaccharide synthesis family protein